jgi:hypothetical protein
LYCRACNRIVPPNGFCPLCGARLPPVATVSGDPEKTLITGLPPASAVCSGCGEALSDDWSFCAGCGLARSERPQGHREPAQDPTRSGRTPPSRAEQERIDEILREAMRLKVRRAYNEALICARRAYIIDPESPDAHALVGEIYYASGSLEEAVAEYTNAVDFGPDRPGFRSRLAALEAELKRQDESLGSVIYEHEGDLAAIFKRIFTRGHPKWYKRGWFNGVLFVAGFTLSLLLIGFFGVAWFLGPLWLKTIIIAAMIATSFWVFMDAQANDRAGAFWALVDLVSWAAGLGPFGLIIYILFRL